MKWNYFRWISVLLMLLLGAFIFIIVGCGGAGSGTSGDDDTSVDDDASADDDTDSQMHDVTIADFSFQPSTVTIAVGDSVRWTNNGPSAHTVTSGNPGDANAGSLFDSGTLNKGDTFTFQFTTADDYVYFCKIHPTMMNNAHVIVQ